MVSGVNERPREMSVSPSHRYNEHTCMRESGRERKRERRGVTINTLLSSYSICSSSSWGDHNTDRNSVSSP